MDQDKIGLALELVGYAKFISEGNQADAMMKRLADTARKVAGDLSKASGGGGLLGNLFGGNIGRNATNQLSQIGGAAREAAGGLTFLQSVAATAAGILSANLFQGAVSSLQRLAAEGFSAVGEFQQIIFSLQSLQAREFVREGLFESRADAMDMAKESARDLYAWMERLAILSPFSAPGLADAFRLAQGFGFLTEEAKTLVAVTTDYTAGMGLSEDAMRRSVLAISQIKAAGRLMGGELLQLVNAGVPALQILADEFGITSAEVRDLSQRGLIPADAAIGALIKGMRELEGSAAASSQTLMGLYNSVQDLSRALLRDIFQPFVETTLVPLGSQLVEALQAPEVRAVFQSIGQTIGDFAQNAATNISYFAGFMVSVWDTIQSVWSTVLGNLTGFTAEAVQAVVTYFADGFNAVVDYGSGLVQAFADGILDAVGYVADALAAIGEMITFWLMPGSPPRLLPDIDKWGKETAQVWLDSFGDADFKIFDELTGKIEGALKAIDPTVDDADIAKIRDGVAKAIGNFRITGQVDTSFLGDLVTRAGELEPYRQEIEDLAKAYFDAALASEKLVQTENELADIERELSNIERGDDARELQRIVENRFATEEQRRIASLKLAKMQKEQDLEAAKVAEEQAQSALDLTEKRFDATFDYLSLFNEEGAAGGESGGSDSARKGRTPKIKKPKELSDAVKLAESLKGKFAELSTELDKGINTSKLQELVEKNPIVKAFDDGKLAIERMRLAWETGVKGMSTPSLLSPLEQTIQRAGNIWGQVLDIVTEIRTAFNDGLGLNAIQADADNLTKIFQSLGIMTAAAYLGWSAFVAGIQGNPPRPDATGFETFVNKLGTAVKQIGELDFVGALTTLKDALIPAINGLFGSDQTLTLDWPAIKTGVMDALDAGLTVVATELETLRSGIVTVVNGLFGSSQTTTLDWTAIRTAVLATLNTALTITATQLGTLRGGIVTVINGLFGSGQTTTLDWTAIRTAVLATLNTALTITATELATLRAGIVTVVNGLFGSGQTATLDWVAIRTAVLATLNTALTITATELGTLRAGIVTVVNGLFGSSQTTTLDWVAIRTAVLATLNTALTITAAELGALRAGIIIVINGLFGSGQTATLDWVAIRTAVLATLDTALTITATELATLRAGIVTVVNGLFGSGQTTTLDWTAIRTAVLATLNTALTITATELATLRAGIVTVVNGLFGSGQTATLDWVAIRTAVLATLDTALTITATELATLRAGIVTVVNGLFGSSQTATLDWTAIRTAVLATLNTALTITATELATLRAGIVTVVNGLFGSSQTVALDWSAIGAGVLAALTTALTVTAQMLGTAKSGIVTTINGLFGSDQTVTLDWSALASAVQTTIDNISPTYAKIKETISEGLNSIFAGDEQGQGGIVATVQAKLDLIFGETAIDPSKIVSTITDAVANHPWQAGGIAAAIVTALASAFGTVSIFPTAKAIVTALAGTSWSLLGVATAITEALASATWAVGGVITTLVGALASGTWSVGGIITALTGALAAVPWAGIGLTIAGGIGLAVVAFATVETFKDPATELISAAAEAIRTGDFTEFKSKVSEIFSNLFNGVKNEDGSITDSSFIAGARKSLAGAAEQLGTFTNELISKIAELLNGIDFAQAGFAIGAFTVSLVEAIAFAITSIKWGEALSAVFGAGSSLLIGLTSGIVAGLMSINWNELLVGAFSTLSDAVVGAITGVVNGVIDALNNIPGINIGRLGESEPVEVPATLDLDSLDSAVESWKNQQPPVQVEVQPITYTSTYMTTEDVNALIQLADQAGQQTGAGFNKGYAQGLDPQEATAAWMTDIKTQLGIQSPSTVAAAEIGVPVGQGILQGLVEAMQAGNLQALTTGMIDGLLAEFTRLKEQALATFSELKEEMISLMEELYSELIDLVTRLVEDILKLFEELRREVVNTLRRTATEGAAAFGQLETALIGVARRAIDGVVLALRDGADRITDTLTGLAGAVITDELKEHWADKGYLLGEAFAIGISRGIQDTEDEVRKAARRVADAAKNAVKDELNIQSPSRVAREELGQPFGEGFLQGALDLLNQAGDLIAGAVGGIVESASRRIGSGIPSLATNSNATGSGFTSVFATQRAQAQTVADGLLDVLPELTASIRDGMVQALTSAEFFNFDGAAQPIQNAAGQLERSAGLLAVVSSSMSSALSGTTEALTNTVAAIDALIERINDSGSNDEEDPIGGGITPIPSGFSSFVPSTVATTASVVASTASVPVPVVAAANTVENNLYVTVKESTLPRVVRNFSIGNATNRAY